LTVRFLISPFAPLTVAALFALAGCGSSGQAAEQRLSPEQFAKRADLICTDAANEQPKRAAVFVRTHPDADEADLVEPAVIPPLERMVEELRTLRLPRRHETQAEAFLEEAEKALHALEENPEAALSEKHNPFAKANHLAAELKLGDCSRNP
jgi:hypothetical protein